MFCAHLAMRNYNVTNINGGTTTIDLTVMNAKYDFGANAGYGDATKGIIIGTSDTPYSPSHYKLQNPISHGSSAGQMLFGVQTIDQPQMVTNGYRLVLSRVFTNVSGSSIIVKEIGVSLNAQLLANVLVVRDVITPITVANGQSLTVRYIFSITSS
jgi:hypothetical protein